MVVIAFVGMAGSGKTTAAQFLSRKGFVVVRLGDITDTELVKKDLPLTEKNEKSMRESLRKDYGMAAYAKLNLPRILSHLSQKEDIVIDGLRSYEEFLYLKKHLKGHLATVHLSAEKELRYKRTKKRKIRPLTRQELESRDASEVKNLNIEKTIRKVDDTILNNSTFADLERQLEKLVENLQGKKLLG